MAKWSQAVLVALTTVLGGAKEVENFIASLTTEIRDAILGSDRFVETVKKIVGEIVGTVKAAPTADEVCDSLAEKMGIGGIEDLPVKIASLAQEGFSQEIGKLRNEVAGSAGAPTDVKQALMEALEDPEVGQKIAAVLRKGREASSEHRRGEIREIVKEISGIPADKIPDELITELDEARIIAGVPRPRRYDKVKNALDERAKKMANAIHELLTAKGKSVDVTNIAGILSVQCVPSDDPGAIREAIDREDEEDTITPYLRKR